MKNKQYAIYAVVLAILAALVYLQFRTWRHFDWALLLKQQLVWRHIFYGICLTYFSYLLRAVRWKIFLRPVKPDASALKLTPPTVIGFTGLALLGRPGELIRPYLIARHEDLSFASQMAVWTVERIFDFGGFAVLFICAIFLPPFDLHSFTRDASPEVQRWIHLTGYSVIALVLGLVFGALLISYRGENIARWVERRFSHLANGLGHKIAQRIREFASGLNTIHGLAEFFQLAVVSVLMWGIIALAYVQVALSYGPALAALSTTRVLLLMFCSMLGSLVQLPGVGGGSQLGTITAMDRVFHVVPKELAVSCGIMLWLVTFMSVVPVGLLLARHERLSLRKLSAESAKAEETDENAEPLKQ